MGRPAARKYTVEVRVGNGTVVAHIGNMEVEAKTATLLPYILWAQIKDKKAVQGRLLFYTTIPMSLEVATYEVKRLAKIGKLYAEEIEENEGETFAASVVLLARALGCKAIRVWDGSNTPMLQSPELPRREARAMITERIASYVKA